MKYQALQVVVLLIYRHHVDELLPLYVILQTSYQEQDDLNSYFDRLSISIELRASGSLQRIPSGHNAQQGSAPVKQEDTIWADDCVAVEKPVVMTSYEKGEASSRLVFAIWEIKALLSM